MSIVRPIVRPIVRAIRQSITGGGAAISRFFSTLDSGDSQYYSIPTVTLTGDYKESALVYFQAATLTLIGDTTTSHSRTFVQSSGMVEWRAAISGVTLATATGVVPINQLSLIEVERIGSNGTIKVNGSIVASGVVDTGNCVQNAIGRQIAFSDGIVANVTISDDTGLIRSYAIDEDLATTSIIRNAASDQSRFFTTLDGANDYYTIPEVTLPGDFEIEFDVLARNFSAIYSILGHSAGAVDFIAVINPTGHIRAKIGGVDYNFSTSLVSLNNITGVKVSRVGTSTTVTIGGVGQTLTTGAASVSYDLIAAIGAGFYLPGIIANVTISGDSFASRSYAVNEDWEGPSTVLVDSISAENGTAVSITSADAERGINNGTAVSITESELFTLEDGDWLGVEQWSYGDVDADGTQAQFATLAGVSTGAGLTPESVYRMTGNITVFEAGGDMRWALGDGSPLINLPQVVGAYSIDGNTGTTGDRNRIADFAGLKEYTVVDISTKRILETP